MNKGMNFLKTQELILSVNLKLHQFKTTIDVMVKQNNEYYNSIKKLSEMSNSSTQTTSHKRRGNIDERTESENMIDQLEDIQRRNETNIEMIDEYMSKLNDIGIEMNLLKTEYFNDKLVCEEKMREIVKFAVETLQTEELKKVYDDMKKPDNEKIKITPSFLDLSYSFNSQSFTQPFMLQVEEPLTPMQQSQIEDWTGMKCGNILFNSTIDNWSENTSVLNDRIVGKKQLIFLIETEERREKFGYYLNTRVVDNDEWKETDRKSFEFNLDTTGRLGQAMKYELLNKTQGGYHLYKKSDQLLLWLGDIVLYKNNKKSDSYCFELAENFNYHDIPHALCGSNKLTMNMGFSGDHFTPRRLLVYQMRV